MNTDTYAVRQIGRPEDIAILASLVCKDCGRNVNDVTVRGIYETSEGSICTDCIARSAA